MSHIVAAEVDLECYGEDKDDFSRLESKESQGVR